MMPTNLYGPGDNFHPENSHVIPGLIHRFHEAKVQKLQEVVEWGTGKPRREFLYVDDMASACVHVMNLSNEAFSAHTEPMLSHINVGTGVDCTIKELVETVAEVTGFEGEIRWDTSKPDGTPRKLLSVEKLIGLGWEHSWSLGAGLSSACSWFEGRLDGALDLRSDN